MRVIYILLTVDILRDDGATSNNSLLRISLGDTVSSKYYIMPSTLYKNAISIMNIYYNINTPVFEDFLFSMGCHTTT